MLGPSSCTRQKPVSRTVIVMLFNLRVLHRLYVDMVEDPKPFNGSFEAMCQDKSMPNLLLALVNMVHQYLHQIRETHLLSMSSQIWKMCQQSLLYTVSVHSCVTHNSQLFHPRHVQMRKISEFEDRCSACFKTCSNMVQKLRFSLVKMFVTIVVCGVMFGRCMHFHCVFLVTVCI